MNTETKTPRLKVGDRVKLKKAYISGIITNIDDDFYRIEYKSGGVSFVSIEFQDYLEIALD